MEVGVEPQSNTTSSVCRLLLCCLRGMPHPSVCAGHEQDYAHGWLANIHGGCQRAQQMTTAVAAVCRLQASLWQM